MIEFKLERGGQQLINAAFQEMRDVKTILYNNYLQR